MKQHGPDRISLHKTEWASYQSDQLPAMLRAMADFIERHKLHPAVEDVRFIAEGNGYSVILYTDAAWLKDDL